MLERLDDLDARLKNLDLTNSIIVQIGMYLNDSEEYSYIDENDKRVLRNKNDEELINNLMNVLLDAEIKNNKSLYEKINEILKKTPSTYNFFENIKKIFTKDQIFRDLSSKIKNIIQNKSIISDESNRWDELKKKSRNPREDNQMMKSKNLEGFIGIYK
jgi:hypothetical protein